MPAGDRITISEQPEGEGWGEDVSNLADAWNQTAMQWHVLAWKNALTHPFICTQRKMWQQGPHPLTSPGLLFTTRRLVFPTRRLEKNSPGLVAYGITYWSAQTETSCNYSRIKKSWNAELHPHITLDKVHSSWQNKRLRQLFTSLWIYIFIQQFKLF